MLTPRMRHALSQILIARGKKQKRQMQSAPRKWVPPSRCSSPLKWIHERSRSAYWEGCEGDESLVLEVRSRWLGFEFSDKRGESEIHLHPRISLRPLLRSLSGLLFCGTSAIRKVLASSGRLHARFLTASCRSPMARR